MSSVPDGEAIATKKGVIRNRILLGQHRGSHTDRRFCRSILFAIPSHPKPLLERLADESNPLGNTTSSFQTDAEICR